MILTEEEKEIITRAADIIFHFSFRVDNKDDERHIEEIAERLEQFLTDYEEEEND